MTILSNIIIPIILGIIEGITEFFPISSSGHIIIFTNIFKIENNEEKILNIVIQTGAALSIFLYFKKQFVKLLLQVIKTPKKDTKKNDLKYYHIILGNIPISLLGLLIHKYIKYLFNLTSIMYALIFGTIFLILAEIIKTKIHSKKYINTSTTLIIGIFQCLALWPGFSRSCATISSGILSGLSQSQSVKFSFILSVPIIFGAAVIDIIENLSYISANNVLTLFVGFTSAFITSKIVIKKYLHIIQNCSLIPFIIYRLILSITIYLFLKY